MYICIIYTICKYYIDFAFFKSKYTFKKYSFIAIAYAAANNRLVPTTSVYGSNHRISCVNEQYLCNHASRNTKHISTSTLLQTKWMFQSK